MTRFIYTASFPSGHATLSAVVYLTLVRPCFCRTQSSVAVKAYILSVAAFLTMIVGVSRRYYLGVQLAERNVIAGWLLWRNLGAGLCWFVMVWLQSPRRRVET